MAVKYYPQQSTTGRVGSGMTAIGSALTGVGDAQKQGRQDAYDTMGNAYNMGLQNQQDRYSQYMGQQKDLYNNMKERPNLFRNNQQENFRNNALRSYLSGYKGSPQLSALAQYLPQQGDLQKRQLEDLRMQSFMDSTYLPTDMFNEIYGSEGQSNLGMELGLPQNGFMQSGVSGARSNNSRYNTEFTDNINNSAQITNQIQGELAKKAHELSSMNGMQRAGLGASLLGAILGMMKPTSWVGMDG